MVTATTPELRHGPPWIMEEMILLEPGVAGRIADDVDTARRLADACVGATSSGRMTTIVGSGTSEHAAMAVASLLQDASLERRPPDPGARADRAADRTDRADRNDRPDVGSLVVARESFEAALDPGGSGLCIGISHEGTTAATVAALGAARDAGAGTALITAVAESPAARLADHVFVTPTRDRSWCHTVGYLSPIVAGAAVAAAMVDRVLDGRAIVELLRRMIARRQEAEALAARLRGIERLLVCGSGLDGIAARELALKVEEGVHMPAAAREIETVLHGHLAAVDRSCGVVILVTDPRHRGRRSSRAMQVARAAATVGAPVVGILSADIAERWAPVDGAGTASLTLDPEPVGLEPRLGSLLSTAVVLQLLTLALAESAGVAPDLIRRDEDAYRAAAAIASASFPIGSGGVGSDEHRSGEHRSG